MEQTFKCPSSSAFCQSIRRSGIPEYLAITAEYRLMEYFQNLVMSRNDQHSLKRSCFLTVGCAYVSWLTAFFFCLWLRLCVPLISTEAARVERLIRFSSPSSKGMWALDSKRPWPSASFRPPLLTIAVQRHHSTKAQSTNPHSQR